MWLLDSHTAVTHSLPPTHTHTHTSFTEAHSGSSIRLIEPANQLRMASIVSGAQGSYTCRDSKLWPRAEPVCQGLISFSRQAVEKLGQTTVHDTKLILQAMFFYPSVVYCPITLTAVSPLSCSLVMSGVLLFSSTGCLLCALLSFYL